MHTPLNEGGVGLHTSLLWEGAGGAHSPSGEARFSAADSATPPLKRKTRVERV